MSDTYSTVEELAEDLNIPATSISAFCEAHNIPKKIVYHIDYATAIFIRQHFERSSKNQETNSDKCITKPLENLPDMRGVKETAAHFGIAVHHARQLALTGKVKAIRAGNKILINQQSVADYFNSCTLAVSQETGIEPIPYRI